jgi:hypothetical protein
MDAAEVRRRLLAQYGIRIENEMSNYVVRRLAQAGDALAQFPVMGGDARTGVPLRLLIDSQQLTGSRSTGA